MKKLRKKKTTSEYEVEVRRTTWISYKVQAHSNEAACVLALEKAEKDYGEAEYECWDSWLDE